MSYLDFIKTKSLLKETKGIKIKKDVLHPMLFEFQKDIISYTLNKGKCCIFAGCGLGKTFMQLEWAYNIWIEEKKPVLILAPLAVTYQTVEEGRKIDIQVNLCRDNNDVINGINITNYHRLHLFDASQFIAVILDESSILKSDFGVMKTEILKSFNLLPYKLACSATPAPNDYMELGNHSEFMDNLTTNEMLSMFFIHDGSNTSKWRLKNHSQDNYWEWVSSWALYLNHPEDLGYIQKGFNLPELIIKEHIVNTENNNGKLFPIEAKSLIERRQARVNSLDQRIQLASDIVNNSNDIHLVWCDLNIESEMLTKSIKDSVEIRGSHSNEYKEEKLLEFAKGNIKCLVTKPKIAGFGLNLQVCHNMNFVGLSDSFEQYYQAVRRCWRFGQKEPVKVNIISSFEEGDVLKNIKRKEKDSNNMISQMIQYTKSYVIDNLKQVQYKTLCNYNPTNIIELPMWLETEKELIRNEY